MVGSVLIQFQGPKLIIDSNNIVAVSFSVIQLNHDNDCRVNYNLCEEAINGDTRGEQKTARKQSWTVTLPPDLIYFYISSPLMLSLTVCSSFGSTFFLFSTMIEFLLSPSDTI